MRQRTRHKEKGGFERAACARELLRVATKKLTPVIVRQKRYLVGVPVGPLAGLQKV